MTCGAVLNIQNGTSTVRLCSECEAAQTNDRSKAVAYAYPSSPSAAGYGFGQTGCYVVRIESTERSWTVAGFATEPEAHTYAEALGLPWNFSTIRNHP